MNENNLDQFRTPRIAIQIFSVLGIAIGHILDGTVLAYLSPALPSMLGQPLGHQEGCLLRSDDAGKTWYSPDRSKSHYFRRGDEAGPLVDLRNMGWVGLGKDLAAGFQYMPDVWFQLSGKSGPGDWDLKLANDGTSQLSIWPQDGDQIATKGARLIAPDPPAAKPIPVRPTSSSGSARSRNATIGR